MRSPSPGTDGVLVGALVCPLPTLEPPSSVAGEPVARLGGHPLSSSICSTPSRPVRCDMEQLLLAPTLSMSVRRASDTGRRGVVGSFIDIAPMLLQGGRSTQILPWKTRRTGGLLMSALSTNN